jgi:hypothetical protein
MYKERYTYDRRSTSLSIIIVVVALHFLFFENHLHLFAGGATK